MMMYFHVFSFEFRVVFQFAQWFSVVKFLVTSSCLEFSISFLEFSEGMFSSLTEDDILFLKQLLL